MDAVARVYAIVRSWKGNESISWVFKNQENAQYVADHLNKESDTSSYRVVPNLQENNQECVYRMTDDGKVDFTFHYGKRDGDLTQRVLDESGFQWIKNSFINKTAHTEKLKQSYGWEIDVKSEKLDDWEEGYEIER
jgi:hypothetical protein